MRHRHDLLLRQGPSVDPEVVEVPSVVGAVPTVRPIPRSEHRPEVLRSHEFPDDRREAEERSVQVAGPGPVVVVADGGQVMPGAHVRAVHRTSNELVELVGIAQVQRDPERVYVQDIRVERIPVEVGVAQDRAPPLREIEVGNTEPE